MRPRAMPADDPLSERTEVPVPRSVPAGRVWETGWGYSRAVRNGSLIEVSGTSSMTPEGFVFGVGDAYAQTRYVLEVIRDALAQLGGSLEDVVRTRVFVVDIDHWPDVGRAHAEFFGEIKPASSCLGGITLMSVDLLVEIEATALVSTDGDGIDRPVSNARS
jgi:enamine deaminase RidA (YjgF/YER057c/UK114 family)